MHDYTYRTIDMNPPADERKLADVLFSIMGKSVHDLAGIVAGLNQVDCRLKDGSSWTVENFKGEMRRLGTWNNSVGAPLGSHSVPGITGKKHEQ